MVFEASLRMLNFFYEETTQDSGDSADLFLGSEAEEAAEETNRMPWCVCVYSDAYSQ